MFKDRKYFLAGILLIAIIFIVNWSAVFQSTELRALDLFRTEHRSHPDIVIVAIDNKSIEEIGRWPWDRKVHADFLNTLRTSEPQVVAFDVNFSEKQNDVNDSAFAFAIGESAFPVLLSTQAIYVKGSDFPERALLPVINSSEVGHVNASQNEYGIVRKFPAPLTVSGETFLPFSFKVAELAGAEVPQSGGLLVNFAGGAGSFQTISYSDILNRRIESEDLSDKILLVGATASDLRDYLLAPVEAGILSGVEWHANVVDNILLSRPIREAPARYPLILGLILSLTVLLLPFSLRTSSVSKVFAGAAIGLPTLSFGLWQSGIAFPFFVNLAGVTIVFVARSFYKWYQTEVEKRRLHKTIQNRFSPQVIDAIMKDPKLLKLGGERKEVTVLFSDIRSFTTISESIEPETLSLLLHEYFTEMTEEVLATDGVLDKFIGDAVMAFWGAPIEQSDQADRAVKAALGMLKRLKVLQEKWKEKGWPFVDIGIGIHSGLATVGNMGSEKRFDYTVIGDTVNAASRLEGLNKEYKTNLIISEATLKKLTLSVHSKSLGSATVKGKTQGINIFEVTE
jgi:adenylate cyclase